ncbi:LysR family transcriptional regulator [Aeromicrobium sp. CTD01-1L150]|uniref:LysR family transcriptional regulator n=1 Tax=Aeromicrobium sp. CTD01-1L150 TaxID=3341830 RepID=UPI0035C05AD0
MVNVTQLEVLIAVVDAGGFSGAAKRLYMSQPSVSNHIRNLEGSMGVQLLERSSRGARPTPAGEVAVRHARQVFDVLASLEHSVAEHRGLDAGRLVVAGTTTLGTYLLPRLISDFVRRAPNVTCQIQVGNEETVESWIVRGEVGLGLCIDEPSEEQLVSHRLFEESMALVAAADSPLRDRTISPGELAGERFLMREMGSATRRVQESALRSWNLHDVERWDLWGPDTLKESAIAGLGVALLSEHVTVREVEFGTLVELDVDPPPPTRDVSLVRRADRDLTPPEELFVQMLHAVGAWPS